MGCDIHIITEIKYPGEPWKLWLKRPYIAYPREGAYSYSNDEIDCLSARNYDFFGILAGVRSMYHGPIASARGLPKNASKETVEWLKENEYHSVTWCSLREMARAIKKTEAEMWADALSDMDMTAYMVRRMDRLQRIRERTKSPIFIPQKDRDRYFDFDTMTVEPVQEAYDNLKAEREFLGLGKPRVRFIIGFDS